MQSHDGDSRSTEGGQSTTPRSHEESRQSTHIQVRVRPVQGGGDAELRRFRQYEVEHDGRRHTAERDAPGQNCSYIVPGNQFLESYRLSTFSKYPQTTAIQTTDLARAGYYYTGYRDRVKCCSCGLAVENWIVGDDVFDPQWHLSDCLFAAGRESRNIPSISTTFMLLRQEFMTGRTPVQGIDSNNLGHRNYGPSLASTRNASINAPMEVDAMTSNMRQVQLNEQLPVLTLARITDTRHEAELKRLDLTKEIDRRKTFAQWPSYPVPHMPSALAKDGFFYLGNLDRVQCFSCSGVLRNWSSGDVVRNEHSRHFTQCRMVSTTEPRNVEMTSTERQEMDEADRQRVSALLPNENTREPPDPCQAEQRHLALFLPCDNPVNSNMVLLQARKETFQNWPSQRTRATPDEISKAGFFYLGQSDKVKCFYCNGGLQNWDYNDEPWSEHAKWFPGCPFVLRSKGVEFTRRLSELHPNLNRPAIRNAVCWDNIPRFQQQSEAALEPSSSSTSTATLETTVFHQPAAVSVKRSSASVDRENGAKRQKSNEETSENGASLLSSLHQMKEEMHCRLCKIKKSDAVFMPCAHLCVCGDCGSSAKRCPVCNNKVREVMKIFRV